MALKLTNNAISTLANSITSAATVISIQGADAGKFPVLADDDWCPATIIDAAGNMEIVRVSARNGSTLTVTRAQEGTTAKAFDAGSRLDVRLTAFAVNDFINRLGHHQHETADINGLGALVQSYVSALVDSSPATLDTLKELAAALGNDPNFATTMTTALAGKVNKASDVMTGRLTIGVTSGTFGLHIAKANNVDQGVQAMIQTNTVSGNANGFGPKINFHKAGLVQWNVGIGDAAETRLTFNLSGTETVAGGVRATLASNGDFTVYNGTEQSSHTPVGDLSFSGYMLQGYGISLSTALSNKVSVNYSSGENDLNLPLGTTIGMQGNYNGVPRNAPVTPYLLGNYGYANTGTTALVGAWRLVSMLSSGLAIARRVG